MTTRERWKKAQEYERGFWEGVAARAAEGAYDQIDFYEWRAGELVKRLEEAGAPEITADSAVVELGSGPVGVAGFLPGRDKVSVDPLNDFYSSDDKLTELRKPDVTYLTAGGEDVPLDSGGYDFAIIENCIDHVQDVEAVMGEIRRLLVDSGTLFLTVNARSRPGYVMHRILARLALDPGHPHTFTEGKLKRLLADHGFEILSFDSTSWWEAWVADVKDNRLRSRLKAALFVSEHLLTVVAAKKGS